MNDMVQTAAVKAEYKGDDALRVRFEAALKEETARGSQVKVVYQSVGAGDSSIAAWRTGKYLGDNAAMDAKVARWLDTRVMNKRVQTETRRGPTFMRTKTADRFITMLEHAQATPDMILMSGEPGLGKTLTCQNYQSTHAGVYMLTAMPAMGTVSSLLESLSTQIGTDGEFRSVAMSRRITRRLSGTSGLIIIDEAHHLKPVLVDQLRLTVFDEAEIGIALVGNGDLAKRFGWDRITGQNAQISSRIGLKLNQEKPFKADVDMLLDGWFITGQEARQMASGIAMKPGALRLMGRVLRNAYALSDFRNDEEPTAKDIRDAFKQLGGEG